MDEARAREHARAALRASLPDPAGARLPPAAARAARGRATDGGIDGRRGVSLAVAPRRRRHGCAGRCAVRCRARLARSPCRARARATASTTPGKYDDAAERVQRGARRRARLGAPALQPGRRALQAGQVRRRGRVVREGAGGRRRSGARRRASPTTSATRSTAWAQALEQHGAAEGRSALWTRGAGAYRRALGADPDDVDAKFNHELVEKKLAELQKKLEEEQKQKQQQQQDETAEAEREGGAERAAAEREAAGGRRAAAG